MSNTYRGRYTLELAGTAYQLVLRWDDLAELRDRFGESYEEKVLHACFTNDVRALAEILAVTLRDQHPELTVPKILELSPPVEEVKRAILIVFALAFRGSVDVNELFAETEDDSPQNRKAIWTLLSRLGEALFGSGSRRASSGN